MSFHKVSFNPADLAQQIRDLCPNRTDVAVLDWAMYPGGAEVISNCKCGGNRSHLTIPSPGMRNILKDDTAAYAAYSLRNCRRMAGEQCPHKTHDT